MRATSRDPRALLGARNQASGSSSELLETLEVRQTDAEKRVSDVIADFRPTVDTARKAAAHFLLWLFIARLIGAFCASFAATIGGDQRDHVQVI